MPRPQNSRNPKRGPARHQRGPAPKASAFRKPTPKASRGKKPIPEGPRLGAHPSKLAERITSLASDVLGAVFRQSKRASSVLDGKPDPLRGFDPIDRRLIARSLSSVFRWWGWIDSLGAESIKEQLLLAWLLDSEQVHPICRIWAHDLGRNSDELIVAGDAPNWTMRAEALKRWAGARTVNADPWRLFPAWFRDQLQTPPGDASSKARRLELLHTLQMRPPLWVVTTTDPDKAKAIWAEVREQEIKPWFHREIKNVVKLDPETDLRSLESFRTGKLWIEDLSSVVLGLICDADPGERWWDACAGLGHRSMSLASQMVGRGFVTATVEWEHQRRDLAKRLRLTPYRNVSVKLWDGRRLPAKPASFDGVLVDAPSSAIGSWRRLPDARWLGDGSHVEAFADQQRQLLDLAAQGVKSGGFLVYSVATLTKKETIDVVQAFLTAHPEFRLAPFANPLDDSACDGTLQLWPHIHDCDARFIARFVNAGKPVTS